VILLCLLLALTITAIITSQGHAAVNEAPFIPDGEVGISKGVVKVWYPMHVENVGDGTLYITNMDTKQKLELPIRWECVGGAGSWSTYKSDLMSASGTYVIERGVMGDGQEIAGLRPFTAEVLRMYLPVMVR